MSRWLLRIITIRDSYRHNLKGSKVCRKHKGFIHKLSIVQKKCNEALYWLDVLHEIYYLEKERYAKLKKKETSSIKLLIN